MFNLQSESLKDAINIMLKAINQSSVESLEENNADIEAALLTLKAVVQEIQARGWRYNSETIELTPNASDEIVIDASYTQVAPLRGRYALMDIVTRSGKLYDKRARSFTFNEPITCDVIFSTAWDDMPSVLQMYARAKAAKDFQSDRIGDAQKTQELLRKEIETQALAYENESETEHPNMLSHNPIIQRSRRF